MRNIRVNIADTYQGKSRIKPIC